MIKFKKMHGNGNDFIIIENLTKVNALSKSQIIKIGDRNKGCLLYTSPSPRDKRQSRMPSSA